MTTVARDYYKLVQRFPLLRIRGDEQLNKAQVIVDVLVDKLADRTITTGEKEYLDALADLVASYESTRFAASKLMTAVEVVRYLMEENGLTQVDLAPLFGGQSRVSDFLAGKRSLSKGQIEKLSERFRLSPTAFFTGPRARKAAAMTAKTALDKRP